jgi:Na+/melibiose symporter-like transporter
VGLLAALFFAGLQGITDTGQQLFGMATAVVVTLPLLLVASFQAGEAADPPRGGGPGWLEGTRLVVRNPAFLRVTACTVLFVTGIAVQGTLHQLVLGDVMGEPTWFVPMVLAENVATLLAVPVWLWGAMRMEKHQALMGAALWLALWSLPLTLLRAGDVGWMVAVIAVRGSSFASVLFLSNALAADVIDVDTVASGSQRSGVFFAIWGMATKLSLALGVLLGTVLPSALGYVPGSLADPEIAGRVMGVYGLVPALLMGAGALALWGFPVTRAAHAELQSALTGRVLPSR